MLSLHVPPPPRRLFVLEGKEYKERGEGDLRVSSYAGEGGRALGRLIMRQAKVRRLLLNEPLFGKATAEHTSNDRMVRVATVTAKGAPTVFVFKFKNKGDAMAVLAAVRAVAAEILAGDAASNSAATNSGSNSKADAVADPAAPTAPIAAAAASGDKKPAAPASPASARPVPAAATPAASPAKPAASPAKPALALPAAAAAAPAANGAVSK